MALTPEERAARAAELKTAREKKYFEAQAKSKAGAEAITPDLPAPDAYVYSYAWKQDVGAPTGEYTLIKNPNPYYIASSNEIVDPKTGAKTPMTLSSWSGPTSFRADGTPITNPNAKNPVTGLTQAQQEAADLLAQAKANAATLAGQLGAQIDPNTGKIIPSTIDPTKAAAWYATQPKPVVTNTNVSGTGVTGTGVTGTGVTGTGVTGTGVTGTGVTGTGVTGPTLAKDVFKQTLAMFFGQADASKPWMDELYNVVSKFYLSGADVSEALNMALLDSRNNPNLKEFTNRFKGIYALMDMKQAGKPVTIPTIAEYVSSQAKMADILTQANLAGIATTEYTGELIGKGNSVSTIADKIANVFNRIDFAPKEIKDTFSRYFPTADRLKLAGALLQGEKGVTQLVDELAQYEVLAAAEAQGLGALGARAKVGGVTAERAQQYARAGGTYQSLLPKFGQIARALPDVQKLTGISRVADISQADVEKAVISQSEQELRRLEDISLQEEARFRAKAGRADIPLASQRRANRAY